MLAAHLTASRFFGGPERQMLELAKELRGDCPDFRAREMGLSPCPDHSGVRSVFISFSETGLCQPFLDEVRRAGFDGIALRHDTPRLLAARRELTNILRQLRADILIPHGYKSNLLGLLAARQLQIPIISVSHGWTWQCFKVRLYEAMERRLLRRMHKVVCVSESQAERVRLAGVPAEKCIAIHDAVRPERFDNPDPAYREQMLRRFSEKGDWRHLPAKVACSAASPLSTLDSPLPSIIVGAAGRLSPEKGFSVLIDAAAQVLNSSLARPGREPGGEGCAASPLSTLHSPLSTLHSPLSTLASPLSPSIGFILFGDGPLREALAQQIAALGLEGRFILAGFHSDLDKFLPHLDLFVQSSFTEGLPNVVLEAMAAGVPVVATSVGGTPEVVEDGVNGYLVPAGDSSALAEQTIRILSDDAQRKAMGHRAHQKVKADFSFQSQAQAYTGLFAELTVKKPLVAAVPAADRSIACSAKTPGTADRPVRVCFVIDRLGIAGTETQLLALIQGLNRAVVQPYLCLLDGNDDQSHALEPKDCPTIRLGVRSLHRPSTLQAAWRFSRFLREHAIDIVQTHFADSTYFAVPVAKLSGVKCIVRTRRDLGYWVRPVDRWLSRLYNPFTTAVVTNCEACRLAVIEQEGIAPDRVVVIPNGIDLSHFQHIPPYKSPTNGQLRRIGMVANLRPVKAPDVFVRAAAIVAAAHPNVVFQIAGTGDAESVRQLARECGINDRLELKGTVRDIPSFLGQLDVAVLTSHSEGLSNSLIEYMAAGRPIVATAVGGNMELIEDGVHGLLVPSADPQSVAQAIQGLLQDPPTAARLGAAGKAKVERTYSREVLMHNCQALYSQLPHRTRSL